MNIGLYNLEPNIVNSAMMQVSQYYKERGANVYEYHPLFDYDKVYAFSLFDFTDKSFVTPDMITGGTGFDLQSRLPKEIEECDYDWSLYPDCDFSMVWFSRGCFRKCNQPVDIQGFDIRIFNGEHGEALNRLKHYKSIKFAWDNPRQNIDDKIEELLDYVKPRKLMCYILIGYWSTVEEDLERAMHLWEDYKIHPYAMPYDKTDKNQRMFVRWCNNKMIFTTRSWQEYLDGNRSY